MTIKAKPKGASAKPAPLAKSSLEHDYSAYKERALPTNILQQLRKVAQDILKSEAERARLADLIEKENAKYVHLTETVMPTLMEKAASKNWTSDDGIVVEVKEDIYASIKEENKPTAFAWLEKNKLGDLIKRQFVISFGKGDESWAKKFQKDLKQRKKPLNSVVKMAVHPQTLNANVKEILQEGKLKLPLEVFGVFRKKVAKVTVPEK